MSVFFDTNILIYADDADAGSKTAVARALLQRAMIDRSGVISTQVMQEFFVIARKKLGLDGAAAKARVELYQSFQVLTISPSLVLEAIDLHRLDKLSFWDALIIRAAVQAGCETLYSEDLQDGRRFGPVQIQNPFRG